MTNTDARAAACAAVKATKTWCADDCITLLQACDDVTTFVLPVRMLHLKAVIDAATRGN